jgi:hypothetical protein
MLGIAGMVRTFTADAAAERQPGEEGLLNEDTPMSIDAIRRGLAMLESGEVDPADGQGDAPSEPPEAVGED